MPVLIEIKEIEDVSAKIKDGEVTLSFKTDLDPVELARVMNLCKQQVPMKAVISSPQARFDLRMEQLDTRTGEMPVTGPGPHD